MQQLKVNRLLRCLALTRRTSLSLSLILSFMLAFLLAACEPSAIEKLTDLQLSERYGKCLERPPTAPGYATACENLKRECLRRKQDVGSYVCPSR